MRIAFYTSQNTDNFLPFIEEQRALLCFLFDSTGISEDGFDYKTLIDNANLEL